MSQLDQSSSTPAAHAVDLTKTYGTGDAVVRALDGVNVEFERGRFTPVMGPSGSGKSTLMHCMAGLDTPTAGRAFVGDQEIERLDDAGLTELRRDRIGFVFQSFNLVPTLTAGENITLPLDLAGAEIDQAWFDYLVGAFGVTLPPASLVFEARTAVVAIAVGVGVTVISAIGPARRAVRIAPVAALVDRREDEGEVSMRRRIRTGSIVGLAGIAALVAGLTSSAIALVGAGAVAMFIGAGTLAPVVARPMSGVLGRPLAKLLGTPGRLGRENSMRSPRRTAQTAAALMVGLALVSAIAVLGASLSKSAKSEVDNAIRAAYIVSGPNSGFSNTVAPAVSRISGVGVVSTAYKGPFELRGEQQSLVGVTTAGLPHTVNLAVTAGHGASALAAGQLLIDTTSASAEHLSVGSVVPVTFAQTGTSMIRVGGVFKANPLIGSYMVGAGYFLAHFNNPLPIVVLVSTRPGAGPVGRAINNYLNVYPNIGVKTRAQFEQSQQSSINQELGLVYVLLALAIVVALIGIVNTLMLSVFERTHELGLLRAVGMKRRQVREMIRSEAVIIALFGAVIGVIIGTALGVAFAVSLKQQGITEIAIPFASLVGFLVLAALLGLVAASWPARRAAKLDVLAAIAVD